MNFTFGISTDFSDKPRIEEIKASIRGLNIPNYEIITVSSIQVEDDYDTLNIHMHDPYGKGWVTKKRNIISNTARYENIVLMNDYFVFSPNWYYGFLDFGDDWDVCSNPQYLITGVRHFTDWVVWDSPIYPRYTSLDYEDWSHTRFMYQSGGYMVVKKDFMKRFPMDESVLWPHAEDVEWSLRMRDHANWKCNSRSIVRHNKWHRDAR